jgi:opacity protein-like surface antigen
MNRKRSLVLSVVICSTFLISLGQEKENESKEVRRLFAGFNFLVYGGASNENTKIGSRANNMEERNFYLLLFPSVGYKVKEGFLLGLGGGYQANSLTKKVSDSNSTRDEKETYQFLRLYFIKEFKISKRIILFTQLSLDYTNETNVIEDFSPNSLSKYSNRSNYFSPILFPGLKTTLSPRLDIELTYGIIKYSSGELITDAGGVDTKYELNRSEINFGLNTITLGFKYHFFKKTNK